MKVLIVGGGGREHALVWKVSQNSRVQKIYCAPGNAGIEKLAECVPISPSDIIALKDFAIKNTIDLRNNLRNVFPLIIGWDDNHNFHVKFIPFLLIL